MDSKAKGPIVKAGNEKLQMSELVANEEENEEEAPIDFGIEATSPLPVPKRPTAPRNLPKKKKGCCNIL